MTALPRPDARVKARSHEAATLGLRRSPMRRASAAITAPRVVLTTRTIREAAQAARTWARK